MVFGPLTGGAFNPARWFGPALVGEEFGGVWPYLVGPLVGALLAAALLPLRDLAPARPTRLRSGRRAAAHGDCRGKSGGRRAPDRRPSSRRALAWPGDAPGHLLAQLHALAVAHLPVLLQVLRVRHAPAHIHAPEEVERRLEEAVRRNAKELLVLTGERPEVNPEVAERLRAWGHDDFTSYVVWTCERALERGLLPHTNLGVLAARTSPGCAR